MSSDAQKSDESLHTLDAVGNKRTKAEAEKHDVAIELEEVIDPKTKQAQHTMQAKVYSPFKTYYEGETFSVSAENKTGPFDILPGHHNFITLLQPCTLVLRKHNGDENIQISGGIMHVKADELTVFLDI